MTFALVLAAAAAILHVYIFSLESLAWTSDRARATFGIATVEEAEVTKSLAYNQGFYNLFLAIATIIGIIFHLVDETTIGATLIFAGTGSMLAAALVLLLSSPEHRSAAIKQGTLPLLAVVVLAIGLLA